MRRFFENKMAFAATVLAFTAALGVNAVCGTAPANVAGFQVLVADNDPTLPPDPWCPSCPAPPGGATMLVASIDNDPTLPPDPWCPSCPPPPGGTTTLVAALDNGQASGVDARIDRSISKPFAG